MTKRADVPGKTYHTWPKKPDEKTVRDHIDKFFAALHQGDFQEAFRLCPIAAESGSKVSGPEVAKEVKRIQKHLAQSLVDLEFIEDSGDETWYEHFTPPSQKKFKGMNLSNVEGERDILANVFIDGEVTDYTAFFDFAGTPKEVCLAFRMLDMM